MRLPKCLANATLNSISIRRASRIFFGNEDAEPGMTFRAAEKEKGKTCVTATHPATQKRFKLRARAYPLVPAESRFVRYAGAGHAWVTVTRALRQPAARDPAPAER